MKQKQHDRCLCVVTNNYCEIFCPEKFLVACVCVYTHTYIIQHAIHTHKHLYVILLLFKQSFMTLGEGSRYKSFPAHTDLSEEERN